MESKKSVLISKQDPSVNFVEDALIGFVEARYVRKTEEYFICYLSSQSGCNRGCRFCHLTTTKQTKFEDMRPIDFLTQAARVLKHYDKQIPAKYVHYNFMARGEILANKYILEQGDKILWELAQLALEFDPSLTVKFNVSTIMPKSLDKSLTQVFKVLQPTIYYSLYSINPQFREKWMPAAMNPYQAFDLLKEYQDITKKKIKIHHCFIRDENDSFTEVLDWSAALNERDIQWDFNLVRYNPYSEVQGQETEEQHIEDLLKALSNVCPGTVKMIPRVGMDVKASCGTFVENL